MTPPVEEQADAGAIPSPSAVKDAIEHLTALATVWERPNHIGAHLSQSGCVKLAARIRTLVAAYEAART